MYWHLCKLSLKSPPPLLKKFVLSTFLAISRAPIFTETKQHYLSRVICNETIMQRYHSARADNNYFEQLKQLPRTPISDSRKNNKSSVSWSWREQITRRKPKKNKQQGKHTREVLRVVCDKVVQTDAINDDRLKINIVRIRKIYLIREGWET